MQWAVKGKISDNIFAAWYGGKISLIAAWCSVESVWQQGVKSKNCRRLPRPLKGQSCQW
jgi:hypothetical protein